MRFFFALALMSMLAPAAVAKSPRFERGRQAGLPAHPAIVDHQSLQRRPIDRLRQAARLHAIEIYPGQALGGKTKGKWGPEMTDDEVTEMLGVAKAADVKIIDTGVIAISSREDEARKLFDWAKKVVSQRSSASRSRRPCR